MLSDALTAAKGLLGYKLIHDTPEGRTAGIIVETEAYTGRDPASHTYGGQTARNQVMFGPAGYAYVYFTYGMHYCFNVVTGATGDGQAVLIRALEPIEGIELMQKRRGTESIHLLCDGPAKLVQATGITKADYGCNLLNGGSLRLSPAIKPTQIMQTARVGIKQAVDRPWRFYIANSPFVSKP